MVDAMAWLASGMRSFHILESPAQQLPTDSSLTFSSPVPGRSAALSCRSCEELKYVCTIFVKHVVTLWIRGIMCVDCMYIFQVM